MLKIKNIKRSLKYAWKGISLVFKTEQNFKIQAIIAAIVIIASFYFKIKPWEAVAIVLTIILVLVLELINTTFERMIDIVVPRMHSFVKDIKDIMAAMVLLASIAAVIIGILIFFPYIF